MRVKTPIDETAKCLKTLDVILFHIYALGDTRALLEETMRTLEDRGYIGAVKEIRVRIKYTTSKALQDTLEVLELYPKVNIIFIGKDGDKYPKVFDTLFKPEYVVPALKSHDDNMLGSDESLVEFLTNPAAYDGLQDYDMALFIHIHGITHISQDYEYEYDLARSYDLTSRLWDVLDYNMKFATDSNFKYGKHVGCNCHYFKCNMMGNFDLSEYFRLLLLYDGYRRANPSIEIKGWAFNLDTQILPSVFIDPIDGRLSFSNRHALYGIFTVLELLDKYDIVKDDSTSID